MYDAPTVARINELRAVSLTRRLTQEEQAEVVSSIRGTRVSASYASAGSKVKKAAAAPIDGADVLAKLMEGI